MRRRPGILTVWLSCLAAVSVPILAIAPSTAQRQMIDIPLSEFIYIYQVCFGSASPTCAGTALLSSLERRFRNARTMAEYLDVTGGLEEILGTSVLDDESRKKAMRLLEETKRLISHTTAARQARTLIDERKFDQTGQLMATILKEASDARSIALYTQLDALTRDVEHASAAERTWHDIQWTLKPVIPFLALILAVYLLLQLIRRAYSWAGGLWGTEYKIEDIADESKLGVSDFIVAQLLSFRKDPRASTAGLLLLNATVIPKNPGFISPGQQASLASSLDSLNLTVGTVNVGAVARTMAALWRWCFGESRRRLVGKVFIHQDDLHAQLTARYPDKSVLQEKSGIRWLWATLHLPPGQSTTSSTLPLKGQSDIARLVAEEVVFRMLYSLADAEASRVEADSADKVRIGLRQLRSYVGSEVRDSEENGASEPPTEYLKRAIECFRSARRSDPSYIDAYVYEGVASDLLEDHQGAIERFEYARKLIDERPKGRAEDDKERQESELQLKMVKYNEAVAHLRHLYSVEGIRKSIAVLDDLLGSTPDAKSDPIIALALAARADAIACWTLHPDEFFKSEIFPALFDEFSDGLDVAFGIEEAGVRERGVIGSIQYKIVVDETVRRVTQITDELFQVLKELKVSRSTEWDERAVLQFEWSITNALGDLYLYAYETWVRRGRLPKVPPWTII
jgi:hypothetical protein